PEERRVIELHPEYGHEMVRGISFLGEAREAVLHHHERMDGTGYPYGLTGGQIPESARVVAVADAFDAMTSTRSYSRARPVPVALRELQRCAGDHFDPRMVTALVRVIGRDGWHPAVTADEPRTPAVPPPPEPVPGRSGATPRRRRPPRPAAPPPAGVPVCPPSCICAPVSSPRAASAPSSGTGPRTATPSSPSPCSSPSANSPAAAPRGSGRPRRSPPPGRWRTRCSATRAGSPAG